MPVMPLPPNEAARLTLLHSYAILDTPYESTFDYLPARAAELFGTPKAALSLVDRDRVWLKAKHGMFDRQLPRSIAFCAYTILGKDVLVVEDLASDVRFKDNPFISSDIGIKFYAGAPLISPRLGCIGTLCVLDHVPRSATAEQRGELARLAREAVVRMEIRLALADVTELLVLRDRPAKLLAEPAA